MGPPAYLPDHFAAEEMILDSPEQKIFRDKPFPLILQPKPSSNFSNIEQTLKWLTEEEAQLKSMLLQYGAILFRGFPVRCPEDYDSFVKAFNYEPLPYIGGAAPRRTITGNVFTANEAPPSQLIPFHHEMAQVPTFPSTLFFHCDVEPAKGGSTPIVLSNEVYRAMEKEDKIFVDKLEETGVVYNRVLPNGDDPESPIGRGWQSTYQTEDREEVGKKCNEQGTTFEWLENGCLRTRTAVLPAIRVDERTGNKTWFNSIIAAYIGWGDVRNDRKKAVTFPDSTEMPEEAMKHLEKIFENLAVDFKWKKGDVLMIDNKQVLHARRTYTPPRRILACLCK